MGTWIGIICLVFIYIYDVRHQTRKIRGIWWRTNCRGEGDNVASTRNYFIICICVFILVFSSIDNVVDIRNDVYWTPVEFEVWGTIVKLFHIVLKSVTCSSFETNRRFISSEWKWQPFLSRTNFLDIHMGQKHGAEHGDSKILDRNFSLNCDHVISDDLLHSALVWMEVWEFKV